MSDIKTEMQKHLDNLTKPVGSLGKLEEYALKIAVIQNKAPPQINKKGIYVFSGDHGITEEGVSLYPSEVTRQMVMNILSGGAAINALAGGTGWELNLVDAATAGGDFPGDDELKPVCNFIRAKINSGSRNFAREDALSKAEVDAAIERGKQLGKDAASRYELTALGDLGIGNTSTAAAMLAAAGFLPEETIDRGTGINDEMLKRKRKTIINAIEKRGKALTGEEVLRKYGSCDFAMIAGFLLGLDGTRTACVLDGFPITAAAYVACMMNPKIVNRLFAGHVSKVAGHKPVLDRMGLDPIVNLEMRLGEGTGAVIGGHIVELAVKFSREMATFAKANVSGSEKPEENY